MKALPPPVPPQIAITIAARRRGWSEGKIALAIGISHQAVNQRIHAYERYFGRVEVTVKHPGYVPARIPKLCRGCGAVTWTSPLGGIGEKRDNRYYCSIECFHASYHMGKSVPLQAMEMRLSGATWQHIAKVFGFSFQAIQRRIWLHLAEQGLLSAGVVAQYRYPNGLRKTAKTGWLERSTGLMPSASGIPRGDGHRRR